LLAINKHRLYFGHHLIVPYLRNATAGGFVYCSPCHPKGKKN
jgi:hypothetical protein